MDRILQERFHEMNMILQTGCAQLRDLFEQRIVNLEAQLRGLFEQRIVNLETRCAPLRGLFEQRIVNLETRCAQPRDLFEQRIVNLETQCAQLRDLFVQVSMNVNSEASNEMISNNSGQGYLREEETVQQPFEAMEISEQEPVLLDQGPEDATSRNIV